MQANPGMDRALARRALERLEESGRRGLGREEVEQQKLTPALDLLQQDGLAVEWNRRWLAVRFTDWVAGVVQQISGGDALIRSGQRGEAGYFVSARNLKGALAGDTVLVRPLGRKRQQRDQRLPEVTVVRVLKRRHQTLVGTLEIDGEHRWLVPFDPKLDLELEVIGGDELLEDQYVVVAIERPARGDRSPAQGRVVEVLGSPDVPGVDVEIVLRHYEIPDEFPESVLAEAAGRPADPDASDFEGREDLRSRTLVTIDGETARDFDDAISVDAMEDGSFLLGVHIADVSHYVEPGSALDLEAYRRGTSVYFPDRAVPMLPEALSNGLCSLRPEVPRLTLSAFLRISPEGEVVERRFAQTVIRSARRLTYSEVRRLLEESKRSDAKEYGEVLPLLETARELMKILYRQRLARGSIDFDLPEGDVILDSEGFTVGVRPGERSVAHRIIEEFMIAANEAVAYELESHEQPALYRVHDPPSRADLEELKEILQPLGLALKGDLEDLHPSAFQKILRRVEGKKEEPFVSSLVLRAMKQALYDPECRGHYALGSRHYTHFTSPIRRYPDLLVHRGLKGLLDGRGTREAEASQLVERLPGIAEHTSSTERRSERSERELLQWKLVRFLAGRIGEEFSGRVTGVQPFGLFVQLADYFVDGLVPIRTLADDYYVFDPEAHRLVGQEKERVFRLADEVRVQLAGVNPRQRGLELKVVGMPEPRAPRRRRSRGLR